MDKAEHTGSAASSSTHLLDPDLRSARMPQLLNHLELVEVPHICVMCAAKDSQRAQRLAAPVTFQLAVAARGAELRAAISCMSWYLLCSLR